MIKYVYLYLYLVFVLLKIVVGLYTFLRRTYILIGIEKYTRKGYGMPRLKI